MLTVLVQHRLFDISPPHPYKSYHRQQNQCATGRVPPAYYRSTPSALIKTKSRRRRGRLDKYTHGRYLSRGTKPPHASEQLLQELVLARDITIHCGHESISWLYLRALANGPWSEYFKNTVIQENNTPGYIEIIPQSAVPRPP